MTQNRFPLLYQVNCRVWLTELSQTFERRATLDDIPEVALDHFADQGFDWIWLLSIWQTGPVAQEISRAHSKWRREFEETLHDLDDHDIAGSGFADPAGVCHVHMQPAIRHFMTVARDLRKKIKKVPILP